MTKDKGITFYRFYSAMRTFMSRLIDSPIDAKLPDIMKEKGLTFDKVINELIKRDIIERHERILDSTNSDKEKPAYSVKYKVKRKNFDRNMHRLYSKYFESDNKLNECDCGSIASDGCSGCDIQNSSDRGQYTSVIGKNVMDRGQIYNPKGKKNSRKIHLTESQLEYIKEFYGTPTNGDILMEECDGVSTMGTIGSVGDYTANGLVLKTSDGRPDPSYNRGGKKKKRKIMVTERQLKELYGRLNNNV